ncbi:hypothetical protein BC938DRAFT_483517 [Jimgerdemannia flammicorona]|uniref:Uncharacterized protein n=1 Tax=Jimgerdemannia flammicorona TaxID=994334 RepID=A0A433QVT0_9FUNG|nr:hypothetical protein BC938DRAFT_483517 [Jimgerdemannia flammicorona]
MHQEFQPISLILPLPLDFTPTSTPQPMHSTIARAAAEFRKPMIRFLGPRKLLWKDHDPHHGTTHPLAPNNLVKSVAQPSVAQSSARTSRKSANGAIEFSELPAKYKHALLTEAEIEAVQLGGASAIF